MINCDQIRKLYKDCPQCCVSCHTEDDYSFMTLEYITIPSPAWVCCNVKQYLEDKIKITNDEEATLTKDK